MSWNPMSEEQRRSLQEKQAEAAVVSYDSISDVLYVTLPGTVVATHNDDGYPVVIGLDPQGTPVGLILIGALKEQSSWSGYEPTVPPTLHLAVQRWYESREDGRDPAG